MNQSQHRVAESVYRSVISVTDSSRHSIRKERTGYDSEGLHVADNDDGLARKSTLAFTPADPAMSLLKRVNKKPKLNCVSSASGLAMMMLRLSLLRVSHSSIL